MVGACSVHEVDVVDVGPYCRVPAIEVERHLGLVAAGGGVEGPGECDLSNDGVAESSEGGVVEHVG